MSFLREPRIGGDDNSWGEYLLAQFRATLGDLSCKLENIGGTLYINPGHFGIDDGTNRGMVTISVAEAISLAGTSNSNWIAIECAISGTAHVLTATDIAGATDAAIIPTSVRNAYDGSKKGYYLTSGKRLISLVWKSAGILVAVISFKDDEIYASQLGPHTTTIMEQHGPGKGFINNIGDWNMNVSVAGTNILNAPYYMIPAFARGIKRVDVIIRDDSDILRHPLSRFFDAADPSLLAGGILQINTTGYIVFYCRTGGFFDSVNFNSTSYNRGFYIIHMREY